MNPHLKLAYDTGAQRALAEAGLVKEAKSLGAILGLTGLGGAVGAASGVGSLPEDATTGQKILTGLTGATLGAGGALTGRDRFGVLGGLAGGALGAGAVYGLGKIAPTGDDLSDLAGRGLAESVKGSLGATLVASSLLPGATLRAAIKGALKKTMDPMMFKDTQDLLKQTWNPARPFSGMYANPEIAHLMPFTVTNPMGVKFLRGMDYASGSPTMGDLVARYGTIDKIPALKYLGGNLKDVALGTAAGGLTLPLALPFQAIAEAGKAEDAALRGNIIDKIKFYSKYDRWPGD